MDLQIRSNRATGVVLGDGSEISCNSIVLTTGTFLNGLVHIGDHSFASGRMGDVAATRLAERLSELDLPLGRLKTGTPPRLRKNTINWDQVGSSKG